MEVSPEKENQHGRDTPASLDYCLMDEPLSNHDGVCGHGGAAGIGRSSKQCEGSHLGAQGNALFPSIILLDLCCIVAPLTVR